MGNTIVLGVLAVIVAWFVFGTPFETIAKWRGASNYEYQLDQLEDTVNKHRIGSSKDVWLLKGSMGVPDRVALFFGYLDDYAACQDAADALNERFTSAHYLCWVSGQE